MLYTAVENSKNIKTSDMIMRTINNMIAETIYDFVVTNNGTITNAGNTRCVNLLKMYNDAYTKTETVSSCVRDPDFIRFSAYVMNLYKDRLKKMSTLFNIGAQPRFTPNDRLHVVLLSEFAKAADVFLQSGTWHNEFVKLPDAESVPYWQGSGTDYAITATSKIDVSPSSHPSAATTGYTGILGVMFDREALGVCNENQRVTTNYNPKAEFFTNWYKVDTGYFNDMNENFVVFYAATT